MKKSLRASTSVILSISVLFGGTAQAFAYTSSGQNRLGVGSSASTVANIISEEMGSYLPRDLEGKKAELLSSAQECAVSDGNTLEKDSPVIPRIIQRFEEGEFKNNFNYANFRQLSENGYTGMIIRLDAEGVDEYIDLYNECPSIPGSRGPMAIGVFNDRQYVYIVRVMGTGVQGNYRNPDWPEWADDFLNRKG